MYGDEIGWLAQGTKGRVEGKNIMFFINKSEVPSDRFKYRTYERICYNYIEGKA